MIKIRTIFSYFICLYSMLYLYFICINPTFNIGIGDITTNLLLILLLPNLKKIEPKQLISFLIQLILLILSYAINDCGFGSIGTVIVFSLIMLISPRLKIDEKFLKILAIFFAVFWIYSLFQNFYYIHNINSNSAAFIVLYIYICFSSLINRLIENKKISIYLILLISIITFLNVIKYECRNVLIIILILITIPFFIKDNNKFITNKKNAKIIWFIITLGSLLITLIYVILYKNNISIDLSFFSENKKFFSGRERIWLNIYEGLKYNYLLGFGNNSIYYPSVGTHNYMLNVLALFGIPHFIIFIINIKYYVKEIFKKTINKNNLMSFLSIICLFLTDFFEASFISGRKLFILFILSIIFFNQKEGDSVK